MVKVLEINDYAAFMVGLVFIYAIIWYLVSNGWLSSTILGPTGQILGLIALVLSAIFVIGYIRES